VEVLLVVLAELDEQGLLAELAAFKQLVLELLVQMVLAGAEA